MALGFTIHTAHCTATLLPAASDALYHQAASVRQFSRFSWDVHHVTWLRYLAVMLLQRDFERVLISHLESQAEMRVFEKCRWLLAEGKQVRELDSNHFSFSLPCYLSSHPCRPRWQPLINLFMGWTELAPIIQGLERLNGGNKRLYPLPICPPVTCCPVFEIPWSQTPICACNSCTILLVGASPFSGGKYCISSEFFIWLVA